MKENTNKAIAINSLFLYIKLITTTITGLITTRYALLALGVTDFGLFSVLGSIISFIGIFNSIMLSASNRFISVAIGRGVLSEINEQFNINLAIHIGVAILTLVVALPLGDWYIFEYLNFEGDIDNAISVFHYSVIGSVIAAVGVPFNGLLMAKERFSIFSITDIVTHILKMLVAISLVYYFREKLLIFAFSQAFLTALTTLIYFTYCKKKFPEIIRFKFSHDISKYKEMFSFSSWVAFGAFATIAKTQGAAILVNAFFNTAMNTALGLANTVGNLASSFANSVAQPMAPQITKSYATGNMKRCEDLAVMSTKYTYLVMLCICTPFLIDSQWIFELWLGVVPDYVVSFTKLIVIDSLIMSFNLGVSNIIFASGKIKYYQLTVNSLRLLALVLAYFCLKISFMPETLLYSYILFSGIIIFVGQIILKKTTGFRNVVLINRSFKPTIILTILLLPYLFVRISLYPLLRIIVGELYLIILVAIIGLESFERVAIYRTIKKILFKKGIH